MSTQRNDLFDNPMVRSARAALSEQDKESYKRMGESLYNEIDFERSIVYEEEKFDSDYESLIESLKSGLHPSYLTNEETTLLIQRLGQTWYTHFGFTPTDLK